MTPRQEFAKAALPGVMREAEGQSLTPSEIAHDCYLHADAMMKAGEKYPADFDVVPDSDWRYFILGDDGIVRRVKSTGTDEMSCRGMWIKTDSPWNLRQHLAAVGGKEITREQAAKLTEY